MHRSSNVIVFKGQQGLTLLEVIIALAIIGLIVPLVLGSLSAITMSTDRVYDRSVLFELAQSQLEDIESQPYSDNASGYTLVPIPEGYSITLTTLSLVTYVYGSPKSTATEETIQLVTVNVTGVQGNMVVNRYRLRP